MLAATSHESDFAAATRDGSPLRGRWVDGGEWCRLVEVEDRFCFGRLAHDLIDLDVHPPWYFWLLHVWLARLFDALTARLYVGCMSNKHQTTVRLDPEDVEALARAKRDGVSASDLIRAGLRVVGARYYKNRRPPSTGLFTAVSSKLGEESELFTELER